MNMSEVCYRALMTGLCTYTELSSTIGLEGALNLIEAKQVAQYNEELMRMIQENG